MGTGGLPTSTPAPAASRTGSVRLGRGTRSTPTAGSLIVRAFQPCTPTKSSGVTVSANGALSPCTITPSVWPEAQRHSKTAVPSRSS